MDLVKLTKWGNSQGVLIPKRYCEQLGLKVGDQISITVDNNKIVLSGPYEDGSLEARYARWDGKGHAIKEVDWGKPVGKEVWW